jgi:hypothetical protein
MPRHQLIIRKATLPTRCEICHLSDQFEPETERCNRCSDVVVLLPASNSAAARRVVPAQFIDRISHFLGISFLLTISSFACLIFFFSITPEPLFVIFFCMTIILAIATMLLLACYCGYWSLWTMAWVIGSLSKMIRQGYDQLKLK